MKVLKHHRQNQDSGGFTLIEVLVALLVLSVGLLGMAGLQAAATQLSHEAHVRSITTVAIAGILDKIRMNTARAKTPTLVLSQYDTSEGSSGTCDPTLSTITNDIICWQETIGEELPGGQGSITDNTDGTFTVTISWFDRNAQEDRSISWTMVASPPPAGAS